MKQKDQSFLQNLLSLYTELYPIKHMYKDKYFKYSPEEAENIVSELCHKEEKIKKPKNEMSEEISIISNEEEVRKYYAEHMLYDRSDPEAKSKCLDKFSTIELKHLYGKLYSTPVKSKISKAELLDLIDKYLERIDRAISMKS